MKIETNFIEKLTKIISENELSEISLKEGETSITIKKDSHTPIAIPAVQSPVQIVTDSISGVNEEVDKLDKKVIVSPMVGTFYAKSSPDAEPFVKVGDIISAGDVVCIVEAMKLMNEIEAESDGVVAEILVENEQLVEYGQPLIRLK